MDINLVNFYSPIWRYLKYFSKIRFDLSTENALKTNNYIDNFYITCVLDNKKKEIQMTYIKLKLDTVKGSSSSENYQNWIDIDSISFSSSRSISGSNTSMRQIGIPNISSISFSKGLCAASLNLIKETLIGKGQCAQIDFLHTDEGGVSAYLTIKLEDCLISNHSISASGGTPNETFNLCFTKIDLAFKEFDENGKGTNQVAFAYNFKEQR